MARGIRAQRRLIGMRAQLRQFVRRARSERGTAVVEFSIVIVPLLLIVFGILDFARALNYYNDMTQLVGQGARAAAVNLNPSGTTIGTANADCPANSKTIQCQLAKTYTNTAELKNGIQVCITNTSLPAVGQPVTLQATYTFNLLSFIGAKIGITNIQLKTTQSERQEATPTYGVGCVP